MNTQGITLLSEYTWDYQGFLFTIQIKKIRIPAIEIFEALPGCESFKSEIFHFPNYANHSYIYRKTLSKHPRLFYKIYLKTESHDSDHRFKILQKHHSTINVIFVQIKLRCVFLAVYHKKIFKMPLSFSTKFYTFQ